ncbi:Increased rDNA silencing protein 4 [Tolypocladium ophioglossoides CBS 100239]|uniref:Increased rDNA silencing protein 4 n=1 Tax=Tolypocladium ophioglossoides (strain CBS 100239) TaxID=1163406 RepID=A0A0L0NBR9_TOLOC|nr:Increased rDNA silencing protein 4 [Tolypocladium ophioglossoides CBS 100239]
MNPAHSSSSSSGHHDDSAAAAALRGASLAFQKKPAVASASPSLRHNGALTAATTVGTRPRAPARAAVAAQATRGAPEIESAGHAHAYGQQQLGGGGSQTQQQQLHAGAGKVDPKSPSFIAATLAASRSASPSPKTPAPAPAPAPRRKASLGAAVDSGPIAPTGSLISMFERARGEADPVKRASPRTSPPGAAENSRATAAPPRSRPSPPPPPPPPPPAAVGRERTPAAAPKRPPTPPPAINIHRASSTHQPTPRPAKRLAADTAGPRPQPKTQEPASTRTRQPSPPAESSPTQPAARPPAKALRIQPPAGPSVVRSTPEVLSPKPVRLVKPSLAPAAASPPRISPALPPQVLPSPSPDPQKRRSPEPKQQPPTPPKPRGSQRLAPSRPASRGRTRGDSDAPSTPYKAVLNAAHASPRGAPASTSPSAPSRGRHTPPPLPGRRRSVASAPSSPTLYPSRRRLTNASTSNLHLDSLTDAIVAGSLASSRLTPHSTDAALPPPSLPNRQRSPRLLQTLRQPAASPDEDSERHKTGKGHRHKLRSGKHAHHEGSRKRWREELTLRERKRYEAVWASNRGWLLEQDSPQPSVASGLGTDTDTSECVANVVVRDIWRRSRLPEDELAEVWDLVGRDARGMLTRQEFVVGMWLVDQRLRGRKIPQRVSDSVWGSANGVTVRKPKAK